MEELKNYVMILIYPSGEVETIPITTYPIHSASFMNHLKDSSKLKEIYFGQKLGHYDISRILVTHGIIEIANKDFSLKIQDAESYKQFSPEFYFYLPEKLNSLEQLKVLEKIEQLIPPEKRIFNEYDDIFYFISRNYFQYKTWKEENKTFLENVYML